jgi:hypothetical protein
MQEEYDAMTFMVTTLSGGVYCFIYSFIFTAYTLLCLYAECRGTKECRGLFNWAALVNNIVSLTRSRRNNYCSLYFTVLKLGLSFAGPHSNQGILEGGKLSTVDLLVPTSLD